MLKISTETAHVKSFVQYSLILLVIGIVSRAFPVVSFIYYIVPAILILNTLLALIIIPFQKEYIVNILIIFVFPVYCLMTALWSAQPLITIQRSVYLFILYAGILSSVLLYKKVLPEKQIGFLIPANILILIFSAFSLIFNIPSDGWTDGNGIGFMGFAGHQNALAAAVLFTLPGVIALGLRQRAKDLSSPVSRLSSFVSRFSSFVLLLAANCFLITLTYSRAAILSLVIGVISYLIFTKSKKILTSLLLLFALCLSLYFTIPAFQNSVDNVIVKDGGRVLDRRTVLWEPSLSAAKLGGIFGLGYGVSAPDIKTPLKTGSHYEDGRYIREKGNSALAVIEETGYIGMLLFLLPIFWIIRKFTLLTAHYSLLTAALAALLVHAQFEGWWVGVGSVSFPLYLIILFMLIIKVRNNNIISK